MISNKIRNNSVKLDSYSILISSKYLKCPNDFINLICVNPKFKETTEKLRFNPIPIKSMKLFPKIQTQYLYDEENIIDGIANYYICYKVSYDQYLKSKKCNVQFKEVVYSDFDMKKYGTKIPDCITMLDGLYFDCHTSVTSINLPPLLKELSNECFSYFYSLKSIDLPSSLIKLGDRCFYNCKSLTSIILPSLLKELSTECFYNCKSLKSINLSSSLQLINQRCFYNCHALKSINGQTYFKLLEKNEKNYIKNDNGYTFPSLGLTLGFKSFSFCYHLYGFCEIPKFIFDDIFYGY
ncbi:Leucine rich repeat containing protein BspA family protein [Entamoeba marina]